MIEAKISLVSLHLAGFKNSGYLAVIFTFGCRRGSDGCPDTLHFQSLSPGDVGSEELSRVGGEWVVFWSVTRLLPLGFRRNSDVF